MEEKKRIEKVEDFIVYQKAMNLFNDFINEDLEILSKHFASKELAKQQIRSLDSIYANTEEGYKGRYARCKKFLTKEIIEKRIGQLDEIQAMLHSLINKLRD